MVIEEFSSQETKAPFNMALSTLEALRLILLHIEKVDMDPSLPDEIKQKMKLSLLKRFYVDSAPLLPDKVVKNYKAILQLIPKELQIVDHHTSKLTKKMKLVYDPQLDIVINESLLKLQQELQKEKYYMPPKKDLGSAVGEF